MKRILAFLLLVSLAQAGVKTNYFNAAPMVVSNLLVQSGITLGGSNITSWAGLGGGGGGGTDSNAVNAMWFANAATSTVAFASTSTVAQTALAGWPTQWDWLSITNKAGVLTNNYTGQITLTASDLGNYGGPGGRIKFVMPDSAGQTNTSLNPVAIQFMGTSDWSDMIGLTYGRQGTNYWSQGMDVTGTKDMVVLNGTKWPPMTDPLGNLADMWRVSTNGNAVFGVGIGSPELGPARFWFVGRGGTNSAGNSFNTLYLQTSNSASCAAIFGGEGADTSTQRFYIGGDGTTWFQRSLAVGYNVAPGVVGNNYTGWFYNTNLAIAAGNCQLVVQARSGSAAIFDLIAAKQWRTAVLDSGTLECRNVSDGKTWMHVTTSGTASFNYGLLVNGNGTVTGTVTSGAFVGNGSGITNLNLVGSGGFTNISGGGTWSLSSGAYTFTPTGITAAAQSALDGKVNTNHTGHITVNGTLTVNGTTYSVMTTSQVQGIVGNMGLASTNVTQAAPSGTGSLVYSNSQFWFTPPSAAGLGSVTNVHINVTGSGGVTVNGGSSTLITNNGTLAIDGAPAVNDLGQVPVVSNVIAVALLRANQTAAFTPTNGLDVYNNTQSLLLTNNLSQVFRLLSPSLRIIQNYTYYGYATSNMFLINGYDFSASTNFTSLTTNNFVTTFGTVAGHVNSVIASNSGGSAYTTNSTPTGTYPGSGAFEGGVLLPDGRVFLVPCGSTTARIYNPTTDTLTTPTGTYPGSTAFVGGVLLPDGRVFIVPCYSTTARIYNPTADTLTTPTGTYAGSGAFQAGVLLPDGRVFLVPYNSTTARIAGPASTNNFSTPVLLGPSFNKF